DPASLREVRIARIFARLRDLCVFKAEARSNSQLRRYVPFVLSKQCDLPRGQVDHSVPYRLAERREVLRTRQSRSVEVLRKVRQRSVLVERVLDRHALDVIFKMRP